MPRLMSMYRSHVVGLRSPVEEFDAHAGKRVVAPGKEVRFQNNYATVSDEDWELFQQVHPELLRVGTVGLADQMTSIPASAAGPVVGSGAQSTRTQASNRAPVAGWDEATTKQIQDWVDAKVVTDPEQAFAYEMAHRRRKMVVRLLTDAMLGDEPAPDPEPAAIAATFTAPEAA